MSTLGLNIYLKRHHFIFIFHQCFAFLEIASIIGFLRIILKHMMKHKGKLESSISNHLQSFVFFF